MLTMFCPTFKEFLLGEGGQSTVSEVTFRDPNMFVAEEIHNHLDAWKAIL